MRKNLSEKLRAEILISNRHSCCVCGKGGVQIHHINSDNSDNRKENLSVLCLEHHDKATAPKGLTASLSPNQIIEYKKAWEEECSNQEHLIARSRTAFFMVDYKNVNRIRQLFSQLTQYELNRAHSYLKEELKEEDKLRKEQGFHISLEPNLSWTPNVEGLLEEILKGNPHPEIFNVSVGHPKDDLLPEGPAFSSSSIPLYDMWCQMMVRCLIINRKTYDIENIMSLENIEHIDINGSLVAFDGHFLGRVDSPSNYKSFPKSYTFLRIKSDTDLWISRLGIKTHYVYSSTAADSLSHGRGNGIFFFRSIDEIKVTSKFRKVRFSCTPLIIGSGGGNTLKIVKT